MSLENVSFSYDVRYRDICSNSTYFVLFVLSRTNTMQFEMYQFFVKCISKKIRLLRHT